VASAQLYLQLFSVHTATQWLQLSGNEAVILRTAASGIELRDHKQSQADSNTNLNFLMQVLQTTDMTS